MDKWANIMLSALVVESTLLVIHCSECCYRRNKLIKPHHSFHMCQNFKVYTDHLVKNPVKSSECPAVKRIHGRNLITHRY